VNGRTYAKGTILRFAMNNRNARMRGLEPGPVKLLTRRARSRTREAAAVAARPMVNTTDFTGN
jgi:hypothetical protein